MIKFEKPRSLYPSFDRKGALPLVTTYCPGCGHGTVHKLIAGAIDELGVQDQTIMLSPVGCSVYLYYYFDTGNVQCSHGRSPAVATGLRRTLENAIVVCYQGDGDLAGIGTTEIVHAANRGENLSVFFVNNAIYGMTGGQMAPTTLSGQKTATTPLGRSSFDGAPIGMSEVINSLSLPVYIERVSLATPVGIMKTDRAIKKALANQVGKKGFSFVEILSPCPVNWKMDPTEAREWLAKNMEPVFPVKVFRDKEATTEQLPSFSASHPMLSDEALLSLLGSGGSALPQRPRCVKTFPDQLIKIGGFGGQGVLSAGSMLAKCAIAEGLNATWLPSYGAEMRGGTANTSIILSSSEIGSPAVDRPNVLLAFNAPSLNAFEDMVQPGGLIIVNSSISDRKVRRGDVRTLCVPASDIAKEEGFVPGANSAMLTAYFMATKILDLGTFRELIPISVKKKNLAELNLKIVERTERYIKQSSVK